MHPKFDTGAAKNLWRAARVRRDALWPCLLYRVIPVTEESFYNAHFSLVKEMEYTITEKKMKIIVGLASIFLDCFFHLDKEPML